MRNGKGGGTAERIVQRCAAGGPDCAGRVHTCAACGSPSGPARHSMAIRFRHLVTAILLAAAPALAAADELVVFCAGAVKPALSALEPAWAVRSARAVRVVYGPAGELRQKLDAGERADVVILPLESLLALDKEGLTDAASRRDLGAVGIGVAVKAGAELPAISTEDSLRRTLLEARSVTFMDPARGTSGRYVDEVLLPRLSIRDAVRAKTVLGDGGMIAEKVARGEVEIALQQMTELLPVAGISIVGALPRSLQKTTVYSGAVTKTSASPAEARGLLEFLVSGDARAVFVAKGFTSP